MQIQRLKIVFHVVDDVWLGRKKKDREKITSEKALKSVTLCLIRKVNK